MSTPRRCLICGSLNESYVSHCSCGASLDVTADESRRVVSREVKLAASWAVLWAIAMIVLVALAIALIASAGVRGARSGVWACIGAISSFVACMRALGRLARARSNLNAIPDLPKASVRRG